METDSILSAIALAISLALFAIASLAEASIASVRRDRIQHMVSEGLPGSAYLERLSSLPMGLTGASSLLRVLSLSAGLISGAALVGAVAGTEWAPIALGSIAILIVAGVVAALIRTLAMAYGEPIATKIAVYVRALAWLLNPLLVVQSALTEGWPRPRRDQPESMAELIPTEIELPVESAGEPLDEREVRMIQGVVQQDKTMAREIMVPRVDMVAVDSGASIGEVAQQMVTGGHSRIPVYKGDLDHIEGIAYAREVLRLMVHDKESAALLVESVVRPALFIPESKTLEELLNEFQQRRVHMAIVVDEYGGVSGLVTIEDLLEEIVGEIQDEFDVGEPEIEPVTDNQFLMDARISIDQLNDLLRVSVEGDGFDTLGGFVYERLGKIPSPGDAVEYDGLQIEVVSTVGRRLKKLRVTRTRG